MKHNKLHGVAHNFADSLAGGLSFVVPHLVIHTHIYAEAAVNRDGFIIADFLSGKVEGAYPEGEIEHAIPLFKNAFPEFCEKHGVDVADYRAFLVRFSSDSVGNAYVVTIEDREGKRTSREYLGSQGRRSAILDELGRRRPKHLSEPMD